MTPTTKPFPLPYGSVCRASVLNTDQFIIAVDDGENGVAQKAATIYQDIHVEQQF